MNVRLRRSLDVISGRPQDVRLGRPRDGQIGSLGDVLETLEGDVFWASWGPIFASWVSIEKPLLIATMISSPLNAPV